MGWTGRPMWYNPNGAERVRLAIEDSIDSECVIDSALVGNNVYIAYKHGERVFGVVILTGFSRHEFLTKPITEMEGPVVYDCPMRILNKLTPTESEYAMQWREKCRLRREEKRQKRAIAREHAQEQRERFKAVFGMY